MEVLFTLFYICGVWMGIIAAVTIVVMPYKYCRMWWLYIDLRTFLANDRLEISDSLFHFGCLHINLVETLRDQVRWWWFWEPFGFYEREILIDQIIKKLAEFQPLIDTNIQVNKQLYVFRRARLEMLAGEEAPKIDILWKEAVIDRLTSTEMVPS